LSRLPDESGDHRRHDHPAHDEKHHIDVGQVQEDHAEDQEGGADEKGDQTALPPVRETAMTKDEGYPRAGAPLPRYDQWPNCGPYRATRKVATSSSTPASRPHNTTQPINAAVVLNARKASRLAGDMFEPILTKGVMIDRLKCQGTGFCVKIAPGLFKLEGDGPAEVRRNPVEDADVDLAEEAEEACPTRAILVNR